MHEPLVSGADKCVSVQRFLPPEFVRQVRERTNIVDLIGERVELRPSGAGFIGLCPFHAERTPSFSVSLERGRYHCFGCQKSGDCFDFLMETRGLAFSEAVMELGQRIGIEPPENPLSPHERRRRTAEEEMREAVGAAARFYQECLAGPVGAGARSYLAARGVPPASAETFGLGYAPADWESLHRALRASFADPVLERAGLVVRRKSGQGYCDLFRNRIIFPISDGRGDRPVAFGGRSLDPGERVKYLNSPDTPIWSKRRTLYPLHRARVDAARSGRFVVVEGYMDAITCHQHGFTNVVASLGTALSVDQAGLLARNAKSVILAYDADAAGQKATLRGIALLQEAGLAVSVAQLPEGKDPDEAIRLRGEQAFAQALEAAQPLVEFLVASAVADRKVGRLTLEERWAVAESILPYLLRLPAGTRDEYTEWVARQLLIHPLRLVERVGVLANKDGRHSNSKAWNDKSIPPASHPKTQLVKGAEAAEEIVLAIMLRDRTILMQLATEMSIHDFGVAAHQSLAERLGMLVRFPDAADDATGVSRGLAEAASALAEPDGPERLPGELLLDVLDSGEARALVARLLELPVPGDPRSAAYDALRRVHRGALEREVEQLKVEQRRLEQSGQGVNTQAMRDLVQRMTELQAELALAAVSARGLAGDG